MSPVGSRRLQPAIVEILKPGENKTVNVLVFMLTFLIFIIAVVLAVLIVMVTLTHMVAFFEKCSKDGKFFRTVCLMLIFLLIMILMIFFCSMFVIISILGKINVQLPFCA